MKSLASILVVSALLLHAPAVEAQAVGGFKPGQTFKMKVTKVDSTKWTNATGEVASPVPGSLPKFRKNQTITLRVRAQGKLKVPKASTIPFNHTKQGVNEYNRSFKRRGIDITHNAEIYRRQGNALRGNLNFFARNETGTDLVIHSVVYKIRRVR